MKPPSLLREALRLLSLRRVALQIGLAALVFALAVLWLRLPDASIWQIAASTLLALVVLAIAGAGQARLILGYCGRPATRARIVRGAFVVLAAIGLSLIWSTLVAHTPGEKDYQLASYLNSKAPRALRTLFSFEHILLWIGWLWSALLWIGTGGYAAIAFAFTASARPFWTVLKTFQSLTFWVALLLGSAIATLLTAALVSWKPGHGLAIEIVSLVLRLGLAVVVDATLLCLLQAILAACVLRTDARYTTPAGTPEDSQPRTAGEP